MRMKSVRFAVGGLVTGGLPLVICRYFPRYPLSLPAGARLSILREDL